VKWASVSALSGIPTGAADIVNVGLSASVGSSALTIAMTQADGSTNCASGTGACKLSFRSATATSGLYNQRSVTGALSLVISSGSTLGHTSGNVHRIYVYALDNAGTVELAASTRLYMEKSIVTTTAEGGAGGADSPGLIYSTTARSNVPIRLIGMLTSTQTTAGTWAAAPSEITLHPDKSESPWQIYSMTITGSTSNPTKATTRDEDKAFWKIRENNIVVRYHYAHSSSSGAANGSGQYQFALPTDFSFDTASMPSSTGGISLFGAASGYGTATGIVTGYLSYAGSGVMWLILGNHTSAPALVGSAYVNLNQATVEYSFTMEAPVL